jgi:hypothetical protein
METTSKKTIKLGKMERDYMCSPVSGKPDKDEPMVERFPTVYINCEELPTMTPGQEVTLRGVVTGFTDKKVRTKEDGKEEVETQRNCEIDILEMEPGAKKEPAAPPEPNDEGAVDKGLDDAMDDDEE